MRYLLFLIFILKGFTARCQAIIKGFIESEQPVTITVFSPYESRYYNHSTITGSLVANNHEPFTIPVKLDNPVMVKIALDGAPVYMWLSPHDTVRINASVKGNSVPKDCSWLRFGNSNSAGQWIFNRIYSYPYLMSKFLPVQDLFKRNLSFYDVKSGLRKIIDSLTYPFDSLYEKNEISAQFRDDVKINFRALLLKEFLKPFERGNTKILSQMGVNADSVYAFAFQLQDPHDNALLRGVLSFQLAESELYFKEWKTKKTNNIGQIKDSILNRGEQQLKLSNTFVPYLYASPAEQEHLWGNMLLSVAELFPAAISHDDLLIFRSYFPYSSYSEILDKNYPSIGGKINTAGSGSHSPAGNIRYLSPVMNDLNTLFKQQLKGRRLYVDLWATWCVPCRQEFKYYTAIDTFLKAHNIEKLFISIDDSSHSDLWKQTAETYNLSGIHLLVSKQLYNNIQKVVFKNAVFTIPKYLIVDEHGDIVDFDADRPSSAAKLQAQFKQLFKLK